MTRAAAIGLLGLGLAQIAGELAGLPALRAIAAATTASPLPKVFSAVSGLETYSTRFFVEWVDRTGTPHSLELTPESYAPLRGAYSRRNSFGAIVAYGAIFSMDARTRPMFERVAAYALCGDAPLLRELGIDPRSLAAPARIRLLPIAGTDLGDLPQQLEPTCP